MNSPLLSKGQKVADRFGNIREVLIVRDMMVMMTDGKWFHSTKIFAR